MGNLTQDFEWSSTNLGDISQWPSNLKNALSIIFQSSFPMLIFWGEDFTVFYNDPYSEILKSGDRHPALGKKAADIWPEGWDSVKPLLYKVYNQGETVFFKDQLIPVLRNGQMEDVYWTFKYSPYYGDEDTINGIIITCSETTDQVLKNRQLQENKEELEFAIEATELGVWDVDPIKNTLKANTRLKEWFGLEHDDEVLLSSATDVIIDEDRPRVLEAINYALTYESGGKYDIQYTIKNPKTGISRIVRAKGRSWFNDDNVASRFNGTLQDVTKQVSALRKIAKSEQRFRNLIEEATVAMAVLTGENMVLELANDAMLQIWGRSRSIIGQELLVFMPEIRHQVFPKLLKDVFDTGYEYKAQDAHVQLNKNGVVEDVYMDFSYKALRNADDEITGILVMATDVTERAQAQKKLAQSEENLRNTILKAPVAMCIFRGPDHVVEIANEKILELWQKTADEVIGKPQFDGLAEARNQGFEEVLTNVYTTGNAFSAQGVPVTLKRDGGLATVYVNFAFEPYRDPEGNVTGIIAVALDVTTQVLATQKIAISEQRVRTIVESAPFPIGVYTGKEMRIELANQTILDIWGKGNDVIGKLYTEILPELENQEIFKQLEQVYTTGRPFHARNQRVDIVVDGELSPFWFNYSFTPLYDATGDIYGVMNTAAEVTDLNLAKLKIEQSEKNFRSMILQAPVAMCILLGPAHTVDIANDFMLEIWGSDRDTVSNKPIWEAVPSAANQGLEELMDHVYSHGETFTAYERPVELLYNGVSKTVYQNFVYQPYHDSDGSVIGVLAISIDVSQQVLARHKIEDIVKERTLELEQVNNNLQKSNAELAQFAYITSHDLQEPVRKITIFTNMLENALGALEERPLGYITKIKSSAARMSNLIKDVLLYSQVSKESQNFTKVELNKIIAETLTDYELVIEQRNATIHYKDLPVVEAIPLQMSQLFGNLISNSLKYTLPEVNPVITLSSGKLTKEEYADYSNLLSEKDYLKIQLKDNGIGFEPQYADKIFNIFQRLHTKSEYTGTGIGLAMCKKIMENHHGDIKAEPRPEGGAIFNVVIPVSNL